MYVEKHSNWNKKTKKVLTKNKTELIINQMWIKGLKKKKSMVKQVASSLSSAEEWPETLVCLNHWLTLVFPSLVFHRKTSKWRNRIDRLMFAQA